METLMKILLVVVQVATGAVVLALVVGLVVLLFDIMLHGWDNKR